MFEEKDIATNYDIRSFLVNHLRLPEIETFSLHYKAGNHSVYNVDGETKTTDRVEVESVLIALCDHFGVDWRAINEFRLEVDRNNDIPLFEMKVYPLLGGVRHE